MEYTKLQSPSLKDLFITHLQNAIISGELSVGERLPGERELAEQMGVSRSVVSAGLHELARKGFVEILPKKRAVVADYIWKGNIDTLNAIMEYEGDNFSSQSVQSILEVRLAAELMAVEKCIANATEEDLHALGNRLGDMQEACTNDAIADAALEFWHALAYYSRDILLPMTILSFEQPVKTLWIRYLRSYGKEELIDNTNRIYNAICNRDVETAQKEAHRSLERAIAGDRPIY